MNQDILLTFMCSCVYSWVSCVNCGLDLHPYPYFECASSKSSGNSCRICHVSKSHFLTHMGIKIKRNDWLLAANHCAYFEFENELEF